MMKNMKVWHESCRGYPVICMFILIMASANKIKIYIIFNYIAFY